MSDEKDPFEVERQVALYQNPAYGYCLIFEYRGGKDLSQLDYVRISEPVTIKFQRLSRDEVMQNAVTTIDRKIQETYAKCEKDVEALRESKQRLLALTHQPGAEPALDEVTL